jgi:hypothetical protein
LVNQISPPPSSSCTGGRWPPAVIWCTSSTTEMLLVSATRPSTSWLNERARALRRTIRLGNEITSPASATSSMACSR